MYVNKFIKTAQNLVKYRRSVYQFLRFSDESNSAFAGTVQDNELKYLQELVQKANTIPGPIIEVGTLFGFTTQALALNKSADKELITIDNFRWNPVGFSPAAHKEFTRRILSYLCETASTSIYEGANVEFYRTYSGDTPSMVFIDAGHSYDDVMVDITWAKEMGVPIISGHDYTPTIPGVVKAVDEVFEGNIETVGTVWSCINR